MGYATNSYSWSVGDPVQFDINFVLGYLRKEDVSVYIDGDVDGEGNQVFQTFTWITDNQIELVTTPVEDCTITVQRIVSKQQLPVDFLESGTATRESLNTGFTYLLMVYHELLDKRLVDQVTTAPVPTLVIEDLINADYLAALIEEAGEE